MRRVLPLVLLLALGCSASPVSQADVRLREFSVESSTPTLAAGEVELRVRNAGAYGHTLVVTDAAGEVVSAGGLLASGAADTMKLDLAPGEYQLTCRIIAQDDEGNVVDHYEEGMRASIRVRA